MPIDGEFSSAGAGEWLGTESPHNKTRLGRVPRAHAADVNRAVQAAHLRPARRLRRPVRADQVRPDRSPSAAKQLAAHATHRRGCATAPAAADPARQREVAEAFMAASRGDDFEGLLAVLDPAVVLRADAGTGPLAPPG
jgi:acyl-CoA reductase-like NAD-dependent aldehyde dehydrogenase